MATRHEHLREDYSTCTVNCTVNCTVLKNVHVQVLDLNCTRERTWIVPQEPVGVLVACPRLKCGTDRHSHLFILNLFGTPSA
jgi:hypothetical protein